MSSHPFCEEVLPYVQSEPGTVLSLSLSYPVDWEENPVWLHPTFGGLERAEGHV